MFNLKLFIYASRAIVISSFIFGVYSIVISIAAIVSDVEIARGLMLEGKIIFDMFNNGVYAIIFSVVLGLITEYINKQENNSK